MIWSNGLVVRALDSQSMVPDSKRLGTRSEYQELQGNLVVKSKLSPCYDPAALTQLTFTCSKLTIKTLEKGVKYGQS